MANNQDVSKGSRNGFLILTCVVLVTIIVNIYTVNFVPALQLRTVPPPIVGPLFIRGRDGNLMKPKVILFWTKFCGLSDWGFAPLGITPFVRLKDCPVTCEMTNKRSRLSDADVIAFHALELEDRPPYKLPNQRWLLFMMESPCYYGLENLKNWKGAFNWTMSYRADSDFIANYSEIKAIKEPKNRNYANIMAKKTKMAAWFVSNCDTPGKREEYVKELQRYMSVDVYGDCGTFKCPAQTPCEKHIYETYKFYLSFENSLANFYLTEKFFKTLKHDIVNVGRSGANYSFYGIKPDWFVDARKFKEPKKLAEFLTDLDRDDGKYIGYLRSKENITSVDEYYEWCEVCKRLYDINDTKTYYEDVVSWWRQNPCIPP